MKQSCLLILTLHLVITVQCAKPDMPYKEWYDKYVRNCTAGSTIKYYKPGMVCTCQMPGVIEFCRYVGLKGNPGSKLRAPAQRLRQKIGQGGKQSCLVLEGSYFDGCNWCGCNGSTKYVTCTDLPCVKLQNTNYKLNNLQPNGMINWNAPGPSNCTKNRFLHEDGCNWCTCNNGWEVCTVMQCSTIKKLAKSDKENPCKGNTEGQFKHEDGCNLCFCMDENTPICTKSICKKKKGPLKLIIKDLSCKGRPPGRFLADDGCNWCYCLGDGPMVCTDITCLEPQIRLPEMLSASICKNRKGIVQPDECNVCYCDKQGTAACTVKLCSYTSYSWNGRGSANIMKRGPDVCSTGKGQFKHEDGCNQCICMSVGEASCSADPCPGKGVALKGKAKLSSTKSKMLLSPIHLSPYRMMLFSLKDKAQKCKSGEKFKEPYGCNMCTCIEDGVVVCDLKTC